MQYEGGVHRPLSEARSLIIQVTIGCSHNECTLCYMHTDKQPRMRKREEILADLDECRDIYSSYVQCVFLADGDALVVKTELLLKLLHYVKKNFPYVERITSYGTAKDVLRKSEEELVALRKAGLATVYLGAELGDDEAPVYIQKGGTAGEVIVAGQRLKRCSIRTSVTLISGLSGSASMEAHAVKSTELTNAMNPEYASILTLYLSSESPMAKEIQRGEVELLKPDQIMDKMGLSLTHIDSPGTVFRMSHASNYLALVSTFNWDLSRLPREARETREYNCHRMESWRRRL